MDRMLATLSGRDEGCFLVASLAADQLNKSCATKSPQSQQFEPSKYRIPKIHVQQASGENDVTYHHLFVYSVSKRMRTIHLISSIR